MVTLPSGSTLGRYRIIQQLGRGGMATVFKAFDPVLDRHMAIKVLPNFDAPDPTFAAAFGGALIQQRLGFARAREDALADNLDRTRAVDALHRGDVYQLMQAYIGTQFDQDEIQELSQPLPDNELVKAPDIVVKANRFLNNDGGDFVAALYGATGSWLSVDEAYAKPPLSTEQILHPEKYLADEAPQDAPRLPDLAAGMKVIEAGWTNIGTGTMGEFLIRSYLEQYLDDAQAAVAAAGWGGDTYALASGPEGQLAFLAQIVWDTSTDASEFFDAYKVFAGIKTKDTGGSPQRVDEQGTAWLWELPEEAIFLGRSGNGTLLIITEDSADLQHVLEVLSFAQEKLVP